LTVHVKLRLYPGEDDDLVAFFEGIPKGLRAVMVKQALRSGTASGLSRPLEDDEVLFDMMDGFVA
jgi:hypothetical protein